MNPSAAKSKTNADQWWVLSQILFSIHLARIIFAFDSYSERGGDIKNFVWPLITRLPKSTREDTDLLIVLLLASGLLAILSLIGMVGALRSTLRYLEGVIIVTAIPLVEYWVSSTPPMRLSEALVVVGALLIFRPWNRNHGMPFFVALAVFHFSVWESYDWIFQFVNTAALLTWGYEMWLRRQTPDDPPDASLAS